MIDKKVRDILEASDWKDISLRLTYFAVGRSKYYGWKSGASVFIGGKSPEDFACEAIEKVWNGNRKWDPEKYPNLLAHLQWIVKSDMNHHYESLMNQNTVNTLDEDKNSVNDGLPDQKAISENDPEKNIILKQQYAIEEEYKKKLYDLVEGDDDLETVLLFIDDGIDKPKEIAEKMNLDVSKVNFLKQKLFRKAKKIGVLLN